jgi:hypothetical protein
MDLFDTRTMLAALEQMLPAQSFILDLFFRTIETSQTKYVDIDIMKGKRRMAPFVNPRLEGKMIEKRGYTTFTYAPPYIKPKMITTADEILKRQMGQTIYSSGGSPASYAQMQLGKDLAEMDEMILRREEWMAIQALQTGKIPVVGEGVDDEIDFSMAANHLVTLSGGSLWSATSTATPIENLEDWAERILQDSGLTVDTIIMGKNAARYFINNADVQKKLDFLKMQMVTVAPQKIKLGARYIGSVDSVADIFVYHDWYYDEISGTEKPMLNPNKVLLGSTQARCTRHYGAIQDLAATGAVPRFPTSWESKDPSGRFVMLQSAPLPAPHQIDGFVCATVAL